MKNLLKSIIVMGLSLVLIATLTNYVFAADENNTVDWADAAYVNSNNANTSSNNTLNTTGGNNTSNTNSLNTVNNASRNTNTNRSANNTNNSVSTNALADTGSGHTGGIIAIALVIGVFVSVYSYKKFSDYRNI